MILAVDVGTSVCKVALWDEEGLVAASSAALSTRHPAPGRAEQDASTWWTAVVEACRALARRAPGALAGVAAVGCTGARQTFAPVDAGGAPTGPGILWADRRGEQEAHRLAARLGVGAGTPSSAGIVLDAASVAAKLAWLASRSDDLFGSTAWILTPRDFVVHHLTGVAATDTTMASRSGLYDEEGALVVDLAGPAAPWLPPVLEPEEVVGPLCGRASEATGLPAGVPVVIGAGDRACEVLGSGGSPAQPMVSWGTTANVSVPTDERPDGVPDGVPDGRPDRWPEPPPGIVASRGTGRTWLLEGGLSAAGSLLDWLARLTGRPAAALAAEARTSPPGARGVVATPWLDGARAPWWRPGAGAALLGIGSAHGRADVVRALFEAVAWEVARCLEAMGSWRRRGTPVVELALTGSGAYEPVWVDVMTGITGLPVSRRRSGRAAGAGAALLAARAIGLEWDIDRLDPVDHRTTADPDRTDHYRELRPLADAAAAAVIGLDHLAGGEPACG